MGPAIFRARVDLSPFILKLSNLKQNMNSNLEKAKEYTKELDQQNKQIDENLKMLKNQQKELKLQKERKKEKLDYQLSKIEPQLIYPQQFQNINVDQQSEKKTVSENESEIQIFKSTFNSEGNQLLAGKQSCIQELEEKQTNEEEKFFVVEQEFLAATIQGQQTDLNDLNEYGSFVSVIKKVNHEFQQQILVLKKEESEFRIKTSKQDLKNQYLKKFQDNLQKFDNEMDIVCSHILDIQIQKLQLDLDRQIEKLQDTLNDVEEKNKIINCNNAEFEIIEKKFQNQRIILRRKKQVSKNQKLKIYNFKKIMNKRMQKLEVLRKKYNNWKLKTKIGNRN